jgi:branched-chain amino acid aminotransferase
MIKSITFETMTKIFNRQVNFNGLLIDPNEPVAAVTNRSLRFGDGLFETMFWSGAEILNLGYHLDRLFKGLTILKFDLGNGRFSREFIIQEINKLCENNAPGQHARIRLNVFREDGSDLFTLRNKPVFIIESAAIPEVNTQPLRLTIFEGEKKYPGLLSNLKTNNYLLNILSLQYAKEKGFDDAVVLNSRGNVCEASTSNLFMVQKGILFTPALSQGCVEGTKRRELLEVLPDLGFQVEETIITRDMIFEMEEIFLSNAIRGIRSVICIDNTYYTRELTTRIARLVKAIPE